MTNEIIPPEQAPPKTDQGFGFVGALMSAGGLCLLVLSLVGSFVLTSMWAFGRLLGFPDWLMLPFYIAGGLVVLAITIWATGRAWHVEQLLAKGKDVDQPVFDVFHYFRKGSNRT